MNLLKPDALVIVDLQRDFLPGGSLAVSGGDAIIAPINRLIRRFAEEQLPIYATRDWHPRDHCSFREQGGPWPPHCVAGTAGADMPAELVLPESATVVSKATTSQLDAYSGFQGTNLAEALRESGSRRLFIAGLATDYCVSATAQDALKEGFEVVILRDAVRAVDQTPGDGERALAALAARGAQIMSSEDVLA